MELKGLLFEMDVRCNAKETSILSDQRRIEQVMLNLIGNAMKFTLKGFVKVVFEIIEGALRFEVRDSGVGIKQESFANLFKMFGKLQETNEMNKTGCGIRLHVS